MKLRFKKSKRIFYVCTGGPWDKELLLLPEETMIFTVGNFNGKYLKGWWHDVRKTD